MEGFFEALHGSWFAALALSRKVEETGVWSDDLLVACIVLAPKTDGYATSLDRRPSRSHCSQTMGPVSVCPIF